MKKYELTNETKRVDVHTLHRIKALRPFHVIKTGDFGGWVENEDNLFHEGNCWVFGNALVYGSARVYENAWISDNAQVYGNAQVFGCASVFQDARVSGYAKMFGGAKIFRGSCVRGNAQIYGNTRLGGNSRVFGDAILRPLDWQMWFCDITLDHGTWEDVIVINDKKYLVSNMLDLYEVPR